MLQSPALSPSTHSKHPVPGVPSWSDDNVFSLSFPWFPWHIIKSRLDKLLFSHCFFYKAFFFVSESSLPQPLDRGTQLAMIVYCPSLAMLATLTQCRQTLIFSEDTSSYSYIMFDCQLYNLKVFQIRYAAVWRAIYRS